MALTGFYAGSFDPVTKGHLDIIDRAFTLVDRLVIGVGGHHDKSPLLSADERIALVEKEAGALAQARGRELAVTVFDGLAVDAAREQGAAVLLRGLRNGRDFDYEMQMSGMNSAMAPGLETVFLAASPETGFISSSLIKQIARLGGDISAFVPESVAAAIARSMRR